MEQQIWQRRQTFEEFAKYAETFAREHGEPGTLSARHLQRLASGRGVNGNPVGQPRPATTRLLERIFGISITELLTSPDADEDFPDVEIPRQSSPAGHELRVAIAVVTKETDVLIVCRRDEASGLTWQFPAGIVKPGTRAEAVAVRETVAETGVRCLAVRSIGSRLHPATNVRCDYVLCEYVAGDAQNADPAENADVTWIDRRRLTRFIAPDQIYRPVLDILGVTEQPTLA
nr:NUDIX hydrolase [Haloechinothrix aidingensis]